MAQLTQASNLSVSTGLTLCTLSLLALETGVNPALPVSQLVKLAHGAGGEVDALLSIH